MHRHNLSLRVLEATSAARAIAFNETNASIHFGNLYLVMEKYKFDPGQIYNMDETGCSTVQTPKKVFPRRGQKEVSQLYQIIDLFICGQNLYGLRNKKHGACTFC